MGYDGSSSKTLHENRKVGPTHDSKFFGPVPSCVEVAKAMADLQSFMSGYYAPEEERIWLNSLVNPHLSTLQQSPGYARLQEAFNMLQNEPAMQKLVSSMASDKAVWEAMMNNREVQELQGSLRCAAEEHRRECQISTGNGSAGEQERLSSARRPDNISQFLKWIMSITAAKLVELIQSIGSLLSEMFRGIIEPAVRENHSSELSHLLEGKIKSAFLLLVVLLLIVIVERIQGDE